MKNSEMIKEPPTQAPAQLTSDQQHGNEWSGMASSFPNRILQLQRMVGNQAVVQMFGGNSVNKPIAQRKVEENNTGLPDNLKSGLESMSGYDLSDVKVHYNSAEPEKLQAHAYAQGNDIHVGPGQEKHLPHEGWHVVQQRQGRVQPTKQLKSAVINDDVGLEKEADVMGSKAYSRGSMEGNGTSTASLAPSVLQGKFGNEKNNRTGLKSNTIIQNRAMQLLSRHTPSSAASSNQVIQRVLSIDTADFSEVRDIEKLGGNEGAYKVEDTSGARIVVKTVENIDNKEMIDSTVMSYNLAEIFGIQTPGGSYLNLDSDEGRLLKAKALMFPSVDLAKKMDAAKTKAVTLWEYVDGVTLGKLGNKGLGDEEIQKIRANRDTFVDIGKMIVFDAAIFNIDRFRIENGGFVNPGNLMFADNQLMGIDQDMARYDTVTTPGDAFDEYIDTYTNMKKLLANPREVADILVLKMEAQGYNLFTGMEGPITEGIQGGMTILTSLALEDDARLDNLVRWSKTFNPDSDLVTEKIKESWSWFVN